jgi:L-lysine exporter family protein LysE/ArgO
MFTFFLKGMGLSASLIMAIGSQNAHVLRMGLRRACRVDGDDLRGL